MGPIETPPHTAPDSPSRQKTKWAVETLKD